MYKEKRIGTNNEHCGTPYFWITKEDSSELIDTLWERFVKKDWISEIKSCERLYTLSLRKSKSWSITSKALAKSANITPVSFLSFIFV